MLWGMWEGVVGRVRTLLAEWDLVKSRAEQDERALEAARRLDADEVARRADERGAERAAESEAEATDRP